MYLWLYLTLPALLVINEVYSGDSSTLWSNNVFPRNNPLINFHPYKHGSYNDGSLTVTKDPAGGNQDVIKVLYKNGTYSSMKGTPRGAQFYSSPTTPEISMTLSYKVYFSPGFDFVMGGKLPGLYGGNIANCSGGHHSVTCFSARLMWRSHGYGEIYVYIPDQPTGFCNRTDVFCFPFKGGSLGRGKWRFIPGEWTKVTEHIHLNTVGKNDGFAMIWINDNLVYKADNIVWRLADNIKINGLFFSTFFGGGSPIWSSRMDCYSYFKEFSIKFGGDALLIG